VTLPPHVTDWPEPWRTTYEERAAIMEYLGGLGRSVAEREAEAAVRLMASDDRRAAAQQETLADDG